MNILVKTFGGQIYFRPDTSWDRKSSDYYVPEGVVSLSYTPVVFARISHAGKGILPRFASRYYETVGYGLLLYAQPMEGPAGFAAATCLDGSSYLPETDMSFCSPELSLGGTPLFTYPPAGKAEVDGAIADVTRRCLLRRGDIVCLELAAVQPLCSENCNLTLLNTENTILDFKIIFCK